MLTRQSTLCLALLAALAGCSSDELTDPFAPMALDIQLAPAAVTMSVSDTISAATRQLSLSATSLGLPVTTPHAEWTTSDASVAIVDSTGTVRAVGLGSATITARVNGEKAHAQIAIVHDVARLSVTPLSLDGIVGDTIQVTASALDASGVLVPGTAYTFTSTDPTALAVTRTGNRTATAILRRAGAVGLVVTAGGQAKTVSGTAIAPPTG